jgi:hypothetical protein
MRKLQEPGKLLSPATIENSSPILEMREPTADSAVAYAIALLQHYEFELRGYTAQELVHLWVKSYSAYWVRLAVIEALYQGRYKAISVEQILAVWARRGQPLHRFNHEFERLISRKLPQKLATFQVRRSRNRNEQVSPDLNLELNLPPVTPSFSDTSTTPAQPETTPQEPTPTVQQERVPLITIPAPELTEIPSQSTDEPPEIETEDNTHHDASLLRGETNKQPIHQFSPPPDSSGFYLKLKAVVQNQEEVQPKSGTPTTDESEIESPSSTSSDGNG